MGYALFCARKLSLTARVNSLNAQLMIISNQQMRLADQAAAKENAANLKANSQKMKAIQTYKSALDGAADSAAAQNEYQEALANIDKESMMTDLDIQGLKMQENALDLRRKSLETQLQAAQEEMKAVEKAEENAIKDATPKYK